MLSMLIEILTCLGLMFASLLTLLGALWVAVRVAEKALSIAALIEAVRLGRAQGRAVWNERWLRFGKRFNDLL